MRGRLIVIAGTGTSVGKTHFAVALLMAWRRRARVVGLKPVESGVVDPFSADTDAARLAAASSFHVKQNHYALRAPLSPHLAARDQGIEIRREVVACIVRDTRQRADVVVVEFAGGLFTPLADGLSNAELAASLQPDALFMVAPDRLGVLHDIGAATRGATTVPLTVDGLVLSAPEVSDPSTGRNAAEVNKVTNVPIAAILPRTPSHQLAELASVQHLLEALGRRFS